jgi:hypothetical protein
MEVKGTAVLPLKEFVKTRFGTRYEEWLQALSPESGKIMEWCLTGQWYPIQPAFIDPTRKICDMFYGGDLKKAWEIGRFSADFALKGFFRIFVRLGSPHFLLSRGMHVFSEYYRPSEIRVAGEFPQKAVIRIVRFDDMHPLIENRIGGWIERAVEISGKKIRRVDIAQSMTKGAPFTEFVVEWE